MKRKQNLLLGVLMAGCSLVWGKTVSTYSDLVATLRAGVAVKAVIDVDSCKYLNDEPDSWEIKTLGARFDDIFERVGTTVDGGKKMRLVATSSHDYVGRDAVHLIRQIVRIFEDGTTEVITQDIDPTVWKAVNNKFLICQLDAKSSGGVTLIADKN